MSLRIYGVKGISRVLQLKIPQAMRVSGYVLSSVLWLPLVGCTLHADKQVSSIPPEPKPVAVAPPVKPPDPQPLSVPQTAVVLPAPQPVNPGAIPQPVAAAPPVAVEKQEAPVAAQHATHRASGPPKAEAEAEPEAPAPAPPAAAEEQQPTFQPLLNPTEQKNILANIDQRKREISDKLAKAKGHVSGKDQTLVSRIESFVHQSDEAQQRGDYAQADSLSERALVLAKELAVE